MSHVLITGVSSGIGKGLMMELSKSGFVVLGSVRTQKDLDQVLGMHNEHIYPFIMDVTSSDSILAAVSEVENKLNGKPLLALVNNAGIVEPGPLELLDETAFHKVMDVNLYGVRRITNAFLPSLRKQNDGKAKIINISSVSGLIPYPFNGAYSISKHALECMSDIYRRELLAEGIDVITIQPGSIKTNIWLKATGKMDQFNESNYHSILQKADAVIENIASHAADVNQVTKVVLRVLQSSNPKSRYLIYDKKWMIRLMRWLPDRWTDRLMMKRFRHMERQRPI